jgi:hypothetical protein
MGTLGEYSFYLNSPASLVNIPFTWHDGFVESQPVFLWMLHVHDCYLFLPESIAFLLFIIGERALARVTSACLRHPVFDSWNWHRCSLGFIPLSTLTVIDQMTTSSLYWYRIWALAYTLIIFLSIVRWLRISFFFLFTIEGNITAGRNRMFGRIQGPPLALYYFTKGSRIEKPRALVTPTSANGQGLHACMHQRTRGFQKVAPPIQIQIQKAFKRQLWIEEDRRWFADTARK